MSSTASVALDDLPVLTDGTPFTADNGAVYCSTTRLAWERHDYWKGLLTKTIAEDKPNGFKAVVQHLEPGAYLNSHGHPDHFEELYVINGDFIDSHHAMQGGDFVYRRPVVPHTAASKYGCDVLVMFQDYGCITGGKMEPQPELQTHALTNPKLGVAAENHAPMWRESAKWKGLSERVVFDDPYYGLHGVVQRLAPGAMLESHGHPDEFEQVLVLSGDFCDGVYRMQHGDYVYRRPGIPHIATTKLGCEVLVVFHKNRGQA